MSLLTIIQHRITYARFAKTLARLNQLQNKIFFIYLKGNYSEKHYFFEKELHKERLGYFFLIVKLYQSHVSKKFLHKIDELFEIITSLGSLRYRIRDHTTFEVCQMELVNITKSISALFKQLMKNPKCELDTTSLESNIQALESIYQKTLTVVLKEPHDFLIFIQDLRALKEKFNLMTNHYEI